MRRSYECGDAPGGVAAIAPSRWSESVKMQLKKRMSLTAGGRRVTKWCVNRSLKGRLSLLLVLLLGRPAVGL